jgi:Fe-S-cluster-containing dehydrogenase component
LSKDKNPGYYPGFTETGFEKMGKKLYPHQVGTTMKCNFCMERIDAGLEKGLQPGIDRDASPACVNTCQARALTFGNLDDPESNVSKLIRDRNGFVLQEEYGTEPSVFYIDGKIGGKSNIAPEWAMTGSHMTHLSSVEKSAREIFEHSSGKQKEK